MKKYKKSIGRKGFYIGKIAGIPFYIHPSWVFILLFAFFSLAFVDLPKIYPSGSRVEWVIGSILITVLFFISLMAHEFFHSMVAIKQGTPVRGITLYIFGGAAQIEQEPNTPLQEIVMALAGPLSSILISGAFYGFLLLTVAYKISFLQPVFYVLFLANGALALFNLAPAFPLDGGRVFRSIVWFFRKDKISATRISVYLSWFLSAALGIYGFVLVFDGNYEGLWLAFISAIITQIAHLSLRGTAFEQVLKDYSVVDFCRQIRYIENPEESKDYGRPFLTEKEGKKKLFFPRFVGAPFVDVVEVEPDINLREALEKSQQEKSPWIATKKMDTWFIINTSELSRAVEKVVERKLSLNIFSKNK